MTIEHRPREIQLTSKQLVFVFMSTVLVAVVVFLLGVWVGRGIGVDSLSASDGTDVGVSPKTTSANPSAGGPPPASGGEGTKAPYSYPGTLQGTPSGPNAPAGGQAQPPAPLASPPPAIITPAPASPPEKSPAPPEKAPAPPQEKKPAQSAQPQPAPSDTESWVVQVGAFSAKAGADKVAADFRSKGYPVTVTTGPKFRVWIGPYPKKAAADQIAGRLRKEGQDSSVIKPR